MWKQLLITILVIGSLSGGSLAFAEKYHIQKMTPEVKSALESRRSRFDQLHQLKQSGAIGENNHGYVEVLKHEGNADSLAAAENQDRRVIYQTIADQNGLEGAIGTIETIFAEVQRNKADPGDQIQNVNGSWTKK